MQTPPYSFHCFLFPFKWEHLFDEKEIWSFADRVNIDKFENKLGFIENTEKAENHVWLRKPFIIESELGYNEYNYFYDFVRDVIYDGGDKSEQDSHLEGKSLVRHYEYILPNQGGGGINSKSKYEIVCDTGGWNNYTETKYTLQIKKIFLDIYETGVGILSYHLWNCEHPTPEDILNINQYGRRAFVGGFQLTNYPSKTGKNHENEKFVDLAKSLSLQFSDGKTIQEDFKSSQFGDTYKTTPYILPKIITELLAGALNAKILTTDWNIKDGREEYIWISPSIDDRMFVASWYCCDVEKHKRQLKGIINLSCKLDWSNFIEKSDFWYKYIFIDKNKGESHKNRNLQIDQAVKATYDRWMNYGTLYGVSRYSFVMFCVDHKDTPDYTLAVFETMYLKMVELSLVQRASVLRFSDEVQYVSSLKDESMKTEQIRGLYKYHIRFINKIDFREITAQEQGIDLYDRMQDAMRVNAQVEYLDKEISQLHDYGLLLEEKRRNEKLDLITYFGLPIALVTLVLSIIGFIKDVKIVENDDKGYPIQLHWWTIFIELFLISMLSKQIYKYSKKEKIEIKLTKDLILIILLILSICFTPFMKAFVVHLFEMLK